MLPPRLKQLIGSTQDPDILMPAVFIAFAGTRVAEVQPLAPGDIEPGQAIFLNRGMKEKMRRVPMFAVLDSWLSPFYGCKELVFLRPATLRKFCRWARARNLRCLARILRNSFIVFRLQQTGSLVQTAVEAGLRVQNGCKTINALVSPGGAPRYFSLTPAKIGLRDWPRIVAQYLARNSRRRRAKTP